jgi:hypothetical protein
MAPDVRSSTGSSSFDFNSQAGVLVVLGAIRASELSPADKNELRDLVFLYSNGGGDAAVRTVLEERLRSANITPDSVPVKKSEPAAEVKKAPVANSGFYGGRPVPVFAPVAPIVVPVAKKVEPAPVVPPVVVAVEAPVPPAPEPVTIAVPPVQPRPVVTIPRPVVVPPEPASLPVPEPVTVQRVTPIMPTMPEPVVVMPVAPQPTPVPPPVAPVAEAPNPAASARLERIRHIKSDINSRVGNPVNLVDLDSVLGREYMSALLEAMKLIADAPDADADRAMNRLETVYTEVRALLEQGKEVVVPDPTPTPAPTPTPVTPIVPVMPVAAGPVSAPVSISVPKVNIPQSEWGDSVSAEVPTPITPVPVRVMPSVPSAVQSAPVVPSPVPSAVPPVPSPVQSVAASQVPLRSITELPTADEVNSQSANGDPLFTKEVDAGLQQLLSEWSLFKKSGLFGTGPSGREHPLFIKIAPLQLPLLLAGRFEGSSPEIRQSVTDYMNGWRYEQGIVYEKDETFEHYLRRVIRHIIDLQNAKRGA